MSSLAILLISINPRDQQVLGLTPYAGLVTRLRGPTADVAAFREPGSAPPTDFQPAGFAVSGTVIDTLNVGWRHRDRHRKRIALRDDSVSIAAVLRVDQGSQTA
jgi:hypothetical protein